MARRNDHTRDELKEAILKTSWDIIEKEGLTNLTARRIAKDIGYTPGTIYNIFTSMDELYLNINAITLDKLYNALSNPKNRITTQTPTQNIKELAKIYADFAKKHKPHWLMLFTNTLPEGTHPPDWYQEKITRLFKPLETMISPLYPENNKQHKIAARVLWASVHGICILEETGKLPLITNQKTPPNITEYLIDNFIAGIKTNQA